MCPGSQLHTRAGTILATAVLCTEPGLILVLKPAAGLQSVTTVRVQLARSERAVICGELLDPALLYVPSKNHDL